jgi:hypothetical protein
MIGKRTFQITVFVLTLCLQAATNSRADNLWSNLMAGNRVEADPAKPYLLKEEQGPWIIMAYSFNGEQAQDQAHDLALELRRRYHVEAFVHPMRFALDDPNSNVQPIFQTPHRHVYRMVSENPKAYKDGAIKEIAVVVGSFTGVDDPAAQKVMQKLKIADPECLHANDDESQPRGRSGSKLKSTIKELPQLFDGRKSNGPLAQAFITRNPLLPDEYFAAKGGLDDLVLKMNKDVKNSLLDCPGKYTVLVAHFTGEVIMNQNKIRAIESGAEPGPETTRQTLANAAEKAHELTEALRMKGYEAYEFHDRCASLVTVGNFDSVGTPRSDGAIEINPRVHQVIERFHAKPLNVPGASGAIQPESLVGIFFDSQPIPVEVPKRSISRQLTQRLEMVGQ